MTHLALPLLAIVDLHASAGGRGVLTAARYAPYVLLAVPAGRRIDACRRRSVLLAACVGQTGVLAAIAGLAVAGALTVWGRIALALALGASRSTSTSPIAPMPVARGAPRADRRQRPEAVSFVIAWASVLAIRAREPVPEPDAHGPSRSGSRPTFSDPLLRAFAGEAATYNFFWTMAEEAAARGAAPDAPPRGRLRDRPASGTASP